MQKKQILVTGAARFIGGHAQNRTGIEGFAILCVTIPPRGQVGLTRSILT